MNIFSVLCSAILLCSCSNSTQTKAIENAKEIQSAIKPETDVTTSDGNILSANIDGNRWKASSVISPETTGRIVGYYKNQYIGIPLSKTDLVTGKKIIIREDNAIDLSLNNGCLWKDIKGDMEITKADDKAVEGKFFFSAVCTSTNKTIEVKDGFFRILISKN